jgi:nucleotide sugar dehydrogenase
MKNISIIGIGKLGLCFALTLEKSGYNILGVDISQEYVDLINSKKLKSSEQGVEEYLSNSKNFLASTSIVDALAHSDVLFVVVATPSLTNGRYNHSQVDTLVEKLKLLGPQKTTKHFVICCTTMPQYSDSVQERIGHLNYVVSYNPEFIAQGTILKNQEKPDMVLIGEGSKEAGDILENIYKNHTTNEPSIHRMSRTEAELCKISLNCFLTTKIAFANMVGDIAIKSNCNPHKILSAIGSDTRIGKKYIGYGYGYGGPCFPRDNRALAIYANDVNINALISKASDESNKLHLQYQVQSIIDSGIKEITFDYVTYKPESVLLEESQQLLVALKLAEAGIKVSIIERTEIIRELQQKYGNIFSYQCKQQPN